METYLCQACGTQFGESAEPPSACPICEDERQFVPPTGQAWLPYADLARENRIAWLDETPSIASLTIAPKFAIGQRALFVRTGSANILWDCVSLVDDATVERIGQSGGLDAIAISHPHYYSCMVEWSKAFGGVPIYLHAEDSQWIQRPNPAIRLWSGDRMDLSDDAALIRCGGHFPGGAVLHWPGGADGRGVLFTGDIVQVMPGLDHVGFMYSFPNYIPLHPDAVKGIRAALADLSCDAIYGAFLGRTIQAGGRTAIERSIERYLRMVGAPLE